MWLLLNVTQCLSNKRGDSLARNDISQNVFPRQSALSDVLLENEPILAFGKKVLNSNGGEETNFSVLIRSVEAGREAFERPFLLRRPPQIVSPIGN